MITDVIKKMMALPTNIVVVVLGVLLLALTPMVSGCNGGQSDLLRAVIASCGDWTVYLSSWWANADDASQISIDAMGGYVLVYWIDEEGNACHGIPGESGQPGPFAVNAFEMDAYDAADEQRELSINQVEQFQEAPFDLGPYASEGMHFVQYINTLYYSRDSSQAFEDRFNLQYSVPEIVSLDVEFCLFPIFAYNQSQCGPTMIVPLPTFPETGQHPDMCKTRVMPDTISLTHAERLNYCLVSLPHGLEITE